MKRSVSRINQDSPQRHEAREGILQLFEMEDLEIKEERIDRELYEYMTPVVNGSEIVYPFSNWQSDMDADED